MLARTCDRYPRIGVLLGLLLVAENVQAQTELRRWSIAGINYVDSLPDLDGDAFPELVIGNYTFGQQNYGRVYAIGSLANQVLYTYQGTQNSYLGANVTTLGDVSGDGFPDFAAGSLRGTLVFDGRNGTLLFESPAQSVRILPLGDMTGDDLAEFLVAGQLLYQGGSFELLYGIQPPPNAYSFGLWATTLGDVDGDGITDFAVGAPGGSQIFKVGRVYAFSGAKGALLYELVGESPYDLFGAKVAGSGDLTGDGIGDLVVAAPSLLVQSPSGLSKGRLSFYNGRTGELFAQLDAPANYTQLGDNLDEAGDVDGNGTGDLLVFARQVGPSGKDLIWTVDGATREILYALDGSISPPFVGGGLDWNGDDFPDFMTYPYPIPYWVLYSGAPKGVSVFGKPCAPKGKEAPRIGASGVAEIGDAFPIHLSRVKPFERALLVLGIPGTVATERIRSSTRDCALGLVPQTWILSVASEVRPGAGVATVELEIPNDPTLVGSQFDAQWLVLDGPTGLRPMASTRILSVQIQPAGTNPTVRFPATGSTRSPRVR